MDEESRLKAIEDQIRDNGDAISGFKSKMDVRFDDLKSKIDRFDELDQKFGELAQQLDVAIASVQSLIKVKGCVPADFDIQRGSSSPFSNQVSLEDDAPNMFDEMPRLISSAIIENQQGPVEVDSAQMDDIGGEECRSLSYSFESNHDSSMELKEEQLHNDGNYDQLKHESLLMVIDTRFSLFEVSYEVIKGILRLKHGDTKCEMNMSLLEVFDNGRILGNQLCSIGIIPVDNGLICELRSGSISSLSQICGTSPAACYLFNDSSFLFDPGGYGFSFLFAEAAPALRELGSHLLLLILLVERYTKTASALEPNEFQRKYFLMLSDYGSRPYLFYVGIPMVLHNPYMDQFLCYASRNGVSKNTSMPLERPSIHVVRITNSRSCIEAAFIMISFASLAHVSFVSPSLNTIAFTVATPVEKTVSHMSLIRRMVGFLSAAYILFDCGVRFLFDPGGHLNLNVDYISKSVLVLMFLLEESSKVFDGATQRGKFQKESYVLALQNL